MFQVTNVVLLVKEMGSWCAKCSRQTFMERTTLVCVGEWSEWWCRSCILRNEIMSCSKCSTSCTKESTTRLKTNGQLFCTKCWKKQNYTCADCGRLRNVTFLVITGENTPMTESRVVCKLGDCLYNCMRCKKTGTDRRYFFSVSFCRDCIPAEWPEHFPFEKVLDQVSDEQSIVEQL